MTQEDSMPLAFPSPPSDAGQVLQQGLYSIQQAQRLDPRGGATLAVEVAPVVMRPHPVYELGLDDLAAGRGMDAARLVAWRYLLVKGNQVHQAAEVFAAPQGGSRFGSLTTGFATSAEQGFAVAEKLPEVQNHTYEIRALRVPALSIMAIWLKDKQGNEDRFIFLPPVFPPVRPLAPYSALDLLSLLQKLAAEKAPLEAKVTPP
jgi:hypothetical protein